MFTWCEKIGLLGLVTDLRSMEAVVVHRPPYIVLYSWPDAAWVASGTFLFASIWRSSTTRLRYAWALLPTSLAVGGEIAQAAGFCSGTFDCADLILCVLTGLASLLSASLIYHDEV